MLFDLLLEESILESISIPHQWDEMSDVDFFRMSDSPIVKTFIPGARQENTGSSRSVWVVNGVALKLAMNKFGIDQNREEVKIGRAGYKYFTKIFDFDPKFRWVVCELAEPITSKEFGNYFGASFGEVGTFLSDLRHKQDEFSVSLPNSKRVLRKLISPIVARQLQSGDAMKLSSWGKVIRNGKMVPVMLDYGFSYVSFYADRPAPGLSSGEKKFFKDRPKDLVARLHRRKIKEARRFFIGRGRWERKLTGWLSKDGVFTPLGDYGTHDEVSEKVFGTSNIRMFKQGFVRLVAFTEGGNRVLAASGNGPTPRSAIKHMIDMAIEDGLVDEVWSHDKTEWIKDDHGIREDWDPISGMIDEYTGWMNKKGEFDALGNAFSTHDAYAEYEGMTTDDFYRLGYVRVTAFSLNNKEKEIWGGNDLRNLNQREIKNLIDLAIEGGFDTVCVDMGERMVWSKKDNLNESAVNLNNWVKGWMNPKGEVFPIDYSQTHEEWISENYGDYEKAMKFGWSRLLYSSIGELVIENRVKLINKIQMQELMITAARRGVKKVYYDGPTGFNILWKQEDYTSRDGGFSRAVGECISESLVNCRIWMDQKGNHFELLHDEEHEQWMWDHANIDQYDAMAQGWLRIIIVKSDCVELLVENPGKQMSRKQVQELMVLAAKRKVKRIFFDGPNGYDVFWEADDAPGWAD